MPLQSKLFHGDKALEACLVRDSAHLTPGTKGPHVAKVQRAVVALDGALIKNAEIEASTYGPSTAKAVLDYKRKRKIINPTYQKTADNIVGKMTIASLDKEMSTAEKLPKLRGCHTDLGGGRAPSKVTSRGTSKITEKVGSRPTDRELPLIEFSPCRLNVAFQESLQPKETLNTNSLRTVDLVRRATELLAPFNMQLSTIFLPSFDYAYPVGQRDDIDCRSIRKAAEKASSGRDLFVRVIFCHLREADSTGVSQGELTGVKGFKNFILINKDVVHPDHGTLLHEMIHCSNDRFMNDIHDQDLNSVLSRGRDRNLLRNEHATSLNSAFFKS